MNEQNYEFCMTNFKPIIAGLIVLVVIVLAWSIWKECNLVPVNRYSTLAAFKMKAPPIKVKDKMLHPYWGNCLKCHITVNAPAKPVSKVMAGPPIYIKNKMVHEYWGNCQLCHVVLDAPKIDHNQAQVAALNRAISYQPSDLGLELVPVTAQLMKQFGLGNEDGLLVKSVEKGSPAEASGLAKGDELIRMNKIRLETLSDFQRSLKSSNPGDLIKIEFLRSRKKMKTGTTLPSETNLATQMIQPSFETNSFGKIAISSYGPTLDTQVFPSFDNTPFLIIYDVISNTYLGIPNQDLIDKQGNLTNLQGYLKAQDIDAVVTGNISSTTASQLNISNISLISGVFGSVASAINNYRLGLLRTSTNLGNTTMIQPPFPATTGNTN